MKIMVQVVSMLLVPALLQACVTNPKEDGVADEASYTTPSIENNSYMYRSPPAAAVRGAGLAR